MADRTTFGQDHDFSGCATADELRALTKEQLVDIVMRQERDCVLLMRILDRAAADVARFVADRSRRSAGG